MASRTNVALVFGASGVSGWAAMENLLNYPSATSCSRIIAVSNNPMAFGCACRLRDPRVEFCSGVDLQDSLDLVITQMQAKIPNIDQVTHVYYYALSKPMPSPEDAINYKKINVKMTHNAVYAVDRLCTNLNFFVLQTGTKHYGIGSGHHDKIDINPPLKEDNPRVPSPYGDSIFYYDQVDLTREAAMGKAWKWCELRPDQILGFIPQTRESNLVESLALYLSLYRYVHGAGATVSFPGTAKAFTHTATHSSQDLIARAAIYLSVVKPDQADGEAFNVADTSSPGSWSYIWPMVAGYFGLKGIPPSQDCWDGLDVWWREHQADYKEMCSEYKLQVRTIPPGSWMFFMAIFTMLDRNRELSLDKLRNLGFMEEIPVGEGYCRVFDRLAEANYIPSKEAFKSTCS